MNFVKSHKYAVIGATGIAAVAIIGGTIAVIKRRNTVESSTQPSCPPAAQIAKYTTNAYTGYGDAADIDGKTEIRGYRSSSRVPIGSLESSWSASRNTNMLIVDAPRSLDGGSLGIREEAEVIVIPLPGWEDSNIKDLVVSRQKQSMNLDPEASICVIISTKFGKSDTVNAILVRKDGKPFPKGFVIPQINAKLGPKGSEDEML